LLALLAPSLYNSTHTVNSNRINKGRFARQLTTKEVTKMNMQQVNKAFAALFEAIKARQAAQFSKDNELTLSYMLKHEKAIKAGMVKIAPAIFDKYLAAVGKPKAEHGNDDGFVAVKVNVKIVRMLAAIGCGNIANADDYSVTIIANTLHNNGILFSKGALASLSSDIEYDAFDQQQILKHRKRKAATTAGTQRSSTRMMMIIMGLGDMTKGKCDDAIKLTEQGLQLLTALFEKKKAAA
jgi:hypothetical protein